MRILLSCVNSAVSLVGYDLATRSPFWYCPGNVLRVCGASYGHKGLWLASDNSLSLLTAKGLESIPLPGPHENLAHSVKVLGEDLLAVADTGNSRILLRSGAQSGLRAGADAGQEDFISLSPLEGWGSAVPADAIHLNDLISWEDGLLASAFNYQPFSHWKRGGSDWKSEGWGVIYYLRRREGRTLSRIVASGLNCPHSLCVREGNVYCCSSARGEFYRFQPDERGQLRQTRRWKITDRHFLRGALRVENGWVLGGSSRRHEAEGGGMALYFLDDAGGVELLPVAGVGEIYDILPWDAQCMPDLTQAILRLPVLDMEGEFPPRCSLPA